MDCLEVRGGRPLSGSVAAGGAKNSALPILAAALMAEGPVLLRRVPQVTDVATLCRLLERLGMHVARPATGCLRLDTPATGRVRTDARLMRKMRASFCALGPLLARRGRAVAQLPGGCRIGDRPIDLHVRGLAALGADIRIAGDAVFASARRLRGAVVRLVGPRGPTVTGTANVLCAATTARGRTQIVGAAREPEIVDLGRFLIGLGARIEGLGSDVIEIAGVEQLGGGRHEVIADRIEAATLLLAGAITRGDVTVTRVVPEHLQAVCAALALAGMDVEQGTDWVRLRTDCPPRAANLTAAPHPGLPTDVQAQFTALLCLAPGRSQVADRVFSERFQHARELRRLGARVAGGDGAARIQGVKGLHGATVTACDLRASAALVLAGLAAHGSTVVRRIHHLDRGYEQLELKLAGLGACIERRDADKLAAADARLSLLGA